MTFTFDLHFRAFLTKIIFTFHFFLYIYNSSS